MVWTDSEAIKLALKRSGLTLAQMDIIDVNEAFAAQFLAVQRELDLPMDKTVRSFLTIRTTARSIPLTT